MKHYGKAGSFEAMYRRMARHSGKHPNGTNAQLHAVMTEKTRVRNEDGDVRFSICDLPDKGTSDGTLFFAPSRTRDWERLAEEVE